jgi:hypothetical protein
MHKCKRLGIRDVLALDIFEKAIAEASMRYAGLDGDGGVSYRFVIADVCNRLHRYARDG